MNEIKTSIRYLQLMQLGIREDLAEQRRELQQQLEAPDNAMRDISIEFHTECVEAGEKLLWANQKAIKELQALLKEDGKS
ncbi:MAG: hypothetical protein ACFE0Q_20695 [Anaerolineae bacterium]